MMKNLLIRKARLIDPGGPHHRQQMDVLIRDGKIDAIGSIKENPDFEIIEAEGLCMSYAAVDIGTQSGTPGNEQRETFESLQYAAAKGGYGKLAIFPDTQPAIENSSMIRTILSEPVRAGVQIVPIGAAFTSQDEHTMAEFKDMEQAGAVAISPGRKAISDPSFMMKALEYLKGSQLTLIHRPHYDDMIAGALVHEGSVSTTLGIKGWPYLSETLFMKRDADLVDYLQASISWFEISSGVAVDVVRDSKARQLKVSASTAMPYLCFDQEDNLGFDAQYKFAPPLRTSQDRTLLWEALRDDVIDFVVSGHQPWEEEKKKLEFPYAAFGAETLETSLAAFLTYCPFENPEDLWVRKAVQNPRLFLEGNHPSITEDEVADLILFDPDTKHLWKERDLESRSKNNPFLGKELRGTVKYRLRGNEYFAV